MMTVRELIEQLEAAASFVGDDAQVDLLVHDGPVDRAIDPHGWWYTLPADRIEPGNRLGSDRQVNIVAEA